MKLVENELVVYNLMTKDVIMHFDYSWEMWQKLLEIVNNMNECVKLRDNGLKEWYCLQTIYGVQYADNKSDK